MPNSFNIVLNNSNVVANTNKSTYQYNFINGNFRLKNAKISLTNVTLPYSWFNISNQWANQTLSIYWVSGTTITAYPITIPAGFYTTSDINNYIQQVCILNGLYLINASGQYVFYIAVTTNVNAYANQLILTAIPNSLPTGYTAPSSFPGYPTAVGATMGISFASSGSVGPLLGFAGGSSYGSVSVVNTTNVSALSTQTPVATPVNSIIIRCNLAYNPTIMPSDILDSIPINTTFGSNIEYSPSFQRWITIQDGTYSSIQLSLFDENLVQLQAQDSHSLFTLMIETEK